MIAATGIPLIPQYFSDKLIIELGLFIIVILLKLGGSVITDKSIPLSFQKEAVAALSSTVSEIIDQGEPVMVVHGGGSFGHHYSVLYDMHSMPRQYSLEGLAAVKNSMVRLNSLILDTMLENGMRPYACPPSVFMYDTKLSHESSLLCSDTTISRVHEMKRIAQAGMCPVTFGDAMLYDTRDTPYSYILSGDDIMILLSHILRPRLAIFATNVDGLYRGGEVMERVDNTMARSLVAEGVVREPDSGKGSDVTGGMRRKVVSADKIAQCGVAAVILNGNKPRCIRDALHGNITGTLFPGVV